uniref:Nucleosome assembly protein n=1 Tax=Schizophyllum commune (strain H4-8 / FGSC 9210) TaxID=578458 RepID=D8PUP2_SCHCM
MSQSLTAPTPQNTPMNHAPISHGLMRPSVAAISEDEEEEEGDGLSSALNKLALKEGEEGEEDEDEEEEELPVEVRRSVEALKGLQVQQDDLTNKFKWELQELEKKYNLLQQPLYERRREIVKKGVEKAKEEDEDYEEAKVEGETGPAAIPSFWLTALRVHPGYADIITERDEGAVKWLTDIKIVIPEDSVKKPGFSLLFYFDAEHNPHFSNEVLIKTYFYQEKIGDMGDWVYDRAIGTTINWKEDDMDLTREFEVKRQRNKSTNRTRLVRKAHPTDSFFNFFSPPTSPENPDDKTEEEIEAIEEALQMDYQLGEELKEKIVPRAIDYFTGKALEFEDLSDDGSDDVFGSDYGDDDDDDDEDDDGPVQKAIKASRAAKKKGASGGQNVNPEECKQQ